MAEQVPTPPAPPEPPEKTLTPEAVAAATAAIEEAQARAAAADFPEREQVIASLLETKGTLNELTEKIRALEGLREEDLTYKELFAVQLANRSVAEQFFDFLGCCIDGTLEVPEGIGGSDPEPSGE